MVFDLTFRVGFAAAFIGIVVLFVGGWSDALLASLVIVGGMAVVVASYSMSDRITMPRWTVDHRGDTVRLFRPTGPEELALVEKSGWRAWPPRLPDQPIFYPVLNREYAATIARDWNVKRSGVGYVTTFAVRQKYLDRYEIQQVGGHDILEYWIPAEDLDNLNKNIVGLIEVVAEYR